MRGNALRTRHFHTRGNGRQLTLAWVAVGFSALYIGAQLVRGWQG